MCVLINMFNVKVLSSFKTASFKDLLLIVIFWKKYLKAVVLTDEECDMRATHANGISS